jgi:hypothetical protein
MPRFRVWHESAGQLKARLPQSRKWKLASLAEISLIAGVAVLVLPSTGDAYLDPGTGSFIFQMIIASVVGGLYTVKTFWRNIVKFFKKDKKE